MVYCAGTRESMYQKEKYICLLKKPYLGGIIVIIKTIISINLRSTNSDIFCIYVPFPGSMGKWAL